MEKMLKIETTGTALYGFTGIVKEKDAETILRRISTHYKTLYRRHGDAGKMVVNISTYNPELPYRFTPPL
jgi:hypothetical protein